MAPAQCQDGREQGRKSNNDEEWRKKWETVSCTPSETPTVHLGIKGSLANGGGHVEGDLVVEGGTHSTCPLGPSLSLCRERRPKEISGCLDYKTLH